MGLFQHGVCALTLVLGGVVSGMAQIPEAERDATLSPYFFVKSQDPAVDQLPLKSTDAKVDIAGVIADVKVVQVYRNEGKKPLEAVYVFPGSTRAAVYGMRMSLGSRVIQAKIQEKGKARQEYEQAKEDGRSASLLEQHRPNVFQMNVANILPGDEIKVELSYTELLVPTEGTYDFVYPTVVGPRYSALKAAVAPLSERWVANPYTPPVGELPSTTFQLEVRLDAGMPIQRMTCVTHRTAITYEGSQVARVALDPSERQGGNRDFILKYQLAGGSVQSGLLLHQGGDENFFLLMVQPPKQVLRASMPPREYVFILDVSGSMHGYPLDVSKKVIRELVQNLGPQDRFNILVFEAGSAVWSEQGSQPYSSEAVKQALAFVGERSGGGGTELLSALKRALALPTAEGYSRTFVIATDGYVQADYRVLDFLRSHLGEANMFAFGIGTSVNRFLIEGIAHAGMGEAFVVTRPEEASVQAAKFRKYISSPALTHLKLTCEGLDAYDIEPLHMPDVLAERPVICFGKWRGEARGTLAITGLQGDGVYRRAFDLAESKPSEANAALRSLWARHRIQRLGDYRHLGALRQEDITTLGLKYGLLTDFTSFIAVDSEVRQTEGSVETISQPLPLPQGVSSLAIRGASSQTRSVQVDCTSVTSAPREMVVACCASGALEETVTLMEVPMRTKRRSAVPVHLPGFRLGAPQADCPEVDIPCLATYLNQQLTRLAQAGLLKGLPTSLMLELRVDETGQVTGVAFDQSCGPQQKKLEARILGWKIKAWIVRGRSTLKVPLQVLQ